MDPKIINRGRGPEISGTRITVYTILEYCQAGDSPEEIAAHLRLSFDQVQLAIRYIEEHKAEVMAEYRKIMDRIRRGNPPELQAKLDAIHARFQARMKEPIHADSPG